MATTLTAERPTERREFNAAMGALERLISEALGKGEGSFKPSASEVRGLPAMWYALSKICGHIGSMPLNLYERQSNGDSRIADMHPAHWLMKKRPNSLTTASVFRQTIQHHALLEGNGRAYIVRNRRGEPSELIVLQPQSWAIVVTPPQTFDGVQIPSRKYHVRVDNPELAIPDEDCLHIMGLSNDGFSGLSLRNEAAKALGLAVAQQTRAVASERNGNKLKFVLSAPPGVFREENDAKKFLDDFNARHAGPENADKTALLREGIKVETISQTNQEAESLDSRKFSRQDIALLTGIEQILGDDSSVSYNSLEMKQQSYYQNCLVPWCTRWEEECAAKLLTTDQYNSDRYYFRFVTAHLLRGTTKERYEVYQIARQIGVLSPNEIRALEERNRRDDPDGDRYDNPAITTTRANAQQQERQPSGAAQARLSTVIRNRLAGLVQVERSRVEQAAAKEKNFCAWLDGFYATWTERVSAAIVECDGDAALAAQWTNDSQQRLLAVAGRVTDGLGEAVRAETALWTERVNQLASAVVGVEV